MGQDLRIEDAGEASFTTSRTVNSILLFQNNPELTKQILAHLAKYQQKYGVILYSFVLMSNHYHMLASYPRRNRAAFKRDFNSSVARLVRVHVKEYRRGGLFGRRYRPQAITRDEDLEPTFLYAALNPVNSGLVANYKEYPGYNSVIDAIKGIEQSYSLVDQREFLNRSRYNRTLKVEEFTRNYKLIFTRLPGYEQLSPEQYEADILKKIEERQAEIIEERRAKGLGFAGLKVLESTVPGTIPQTTKTSSRNSERPLILTSCVKTKAIYLEKYFTVRAMFTEAFQALKEGIKEVIFPQGTYHPPLMWASD